MRKLSAVLAGLAVVLTVSTPAWADTGQHRHRGFRGQSDSRGGGSSRGDNLQHDDPSVLF